MRIGLLGAASLSLVAFAAEAQMPAHVPEKDPNCGRACLESYRSLASTPEHLFTADDLARRSEEHGELIARLVDLGHRLGFACWVGLRQQARRVGSNI